MPFSLERLPAFTSFLAGEDRPWSDLQLTPQSLLELCAAEDLHTLVYSRLSGSAYAGEWPERLQDALSTEARRQAAAEMVRAAEIRAVIDALADAGVPSVLLKGAALAYTIYPTPASRSRRDTDLIVHPDHVDLARRVLASSGYQATAHCDELFSQFEVQKPDGFGVAHVFDVHWKISTQPVFGDVSSFDELLGGARPVPALGPNARAACPLDALLLACIHPVMHHRNADCALWNYDVHLLAAHLTAADFDEFVRRAHRKKVAAICARRLRLAESVFGTVFPAGVVTALAAAGRSEPSAEYLAPRRRWHHELVSSLRALSSAGDRARWLREVLFPLPAYMLSVYGVAGKPYARLLLPILYAHRNLRGAGRVLLGKK